MTDHPTPRNAGVGRRRFLTRISAALAASAWPAVGAPPRGATPPHPLKLAVFSGMFKNVPLTAVMDTISAIGFDGIEIAAGYGTDHLDADRTGDDARRIRADAARRRLAICLIYTRLGGDVLAGEKQRAEGLAGVRRFLEIGDAMGCGLVKVTAGRLRNSAFREDEARVVADWIGQACDAAATRGARVVTEIHFGQYCETTDMACRLIDRVNRPNFGVIHDAGNMHITGDSYGEESVLRLGDRIFHVHVKDMVKAAPDDAVAHDYPAGRFKRAPLNQGNVDHLSLFRALARAGYKGYLSCEATGGDDPPAVARHEYAEMRKLLAQVAAG